MFFVKKDFTFGFRTVKSVEIHLIQTTNVPMLIYEFPSSSFRYRANPNLFRRSFEPYDQMLYHRMVLEPHTAYPIPAGTRYILLTVQKTVFDSPVQIPVFQPPVPTTPPVQLFLPDAPPVQILLPDPPVVETLEPTLTDDSSIDQIMSSLFGDCSQQGLPPAHTQEPQLLDTVPSLFLTRVIISSRSWIILKQGRWPGRVTYYEQDYPYTIIFEPNFGVHIPRSFGSEVNVGFSGARANFGQAAPNTC
ncbi:hypothetical protein TNCV_1616301 [Trichonephila clavipes]|nr:hypothetical protein TNCV_1616301 [Trichonephila clavipes]